LNRATYLCQGTVLVKAGEGSEVLLGDVGSVVLEDEGVGVGGVTDDKDLTKGRGKKSFKKKRIVRDGEESKSIPGS
jgi:hypothetical protein